jgi:hypothetical protein
MLLFSFKMFISSMISNMLSDMKGIAFLCKKIFVSVEICQPDIRLVLSKCIVDIHVTVTASDIVGALCRLCEPLLCL